MGLFDIFSSVFHASSSSSGIYCPECGTEMNENNAEMSLTCPSCGYTFNTTCGYNYDGDMDYSYDEDDDIPEGCAACGGPYPDCKTSCKLFDD